MAGNQFGASQVFFSFHSCLHSLSACNKDISNSHNLKREKPRMEEEAEMEVMVAVVEAEEQGLEDGRFRS